MTDYSSSSSYFAADETRFWPHRYTATLVVERLVGGVPTDPKVAEGWLRTKLAPNDDLLRELVAETMVSRGISADEAVKEVDNLKHLNGFERDEQGLYITGRQVKAAIKEAANVAAAVGNLPLKKWGLTGKGLMGFVAEHVVVPESRVHLMRDEPSGIQQRFVHTFRGSGIQYEEYVDDAILTFSVVTDWPFSDEQWSAIWLTGEKQGIGASRSQGFGRYKVLRWQLA